jgi:nucleoside-diphosphate-sugar epimerase
MRDRIAILGAGGFLGARLVERSLLAGDERVVPILRYPRGLAKLSRLAPGWRRGDASKPDELVTVLRDCRVVVNLTTGADDRILPDTAALVEACLKAGVKRLIHMSSASVYGQVPTSNLPDDAPPLPDLWMEYAREKGRAEAHLRGLMGNCGLEITVLRPGMIWGPGSIWLGGPAEALQSGTAFLLGGGRGVCNLIHVDNLSDDLLGVADFEGDSTGFFHSADDEDLNWKQLYTALAMEIGVDPSGIHEVEMPTWNGGLTSAFGSISDHPWAKAVKRRMTKEFKLKVKRQIREFRKSWSSERGQGRPGPVVTKVMWWNQGTRHRLPTTAFAKKFGRSGRMTFEEGVARGGRWLRFAGFSVDPFERSELPGHS